MKTTKEQLARAFEYFCSEYGYRIAKSYDDHGALRLDHNSIYGGYNIERIADEGSGISFPFDSGNRHSATELYDMLWFAIRVKQHQTQIQKVA